MSDHLPDSYAGAGVDLDAAEEIVTRLRPHAQRTRREEVVGGFGGFCGLFAVPPGFRQPVLVSATDGVGTKLELARQLGRLDTVGIDLVAMVVDDIVTSGAEPLFLLDYIATERLDPDAVEQVVAGIADGCEQAGCALVGGETAEHPGVMPPGQLDVAGFGVGVVERDLLLGPQRVGSGDAIVAMAANGLHSNGYALARRLVAGLDLASDHGLRVQSLGDALLRPTPIYARACLKLLRQTEVHALCHVTGGGIPGNLPRVLPEGLGAVVDTSTFTPPMVFDVLQRRGNITDAEMWRTFNMGAGMLALAADGREAVELLRADGVDAWVCGAVDGSGRVRLKRP
ncbi:MAG: phosphoribosylformylglycinamidine cyclo-ligase [Euzebyales bacterium]|nr:phosphoribosylformylglycinamidine cyclo-ligase [Euzebyales bacterium]MBA3622305.1 phosphoribosylformylglycinamidine cyclo-ligase [Euzebyales bacterium]